VKQQERLRPKGQLEFGRSSPGAPRETRGDNGHLGIRAALAEVFPRPGEPRCWNRRNRKVIDHRPAVEEAVGQGVGAAQSDCVC
jgi:hypothetical protein